MLIKWRAEPPGWFRNKEEAVWRNSQVAQGLLQPILEYLQGQGIHSFSGSFFQCLTTP